MPSPDSSVAAESGPRRLRRLRLDVHQGLAGRPGRGPDRRGGRAPHHHRHRRPRRVRRVPGRAGRAGPPRRGRRRPWPARAPAAACGSPWSATRSWSPPRPAAGSPCRAAARWSPCSRRAGGDDLTRVGDSEPDVVLLTGGTDGGNPEPILACARALGHVLERPGRGRRERRGARRGGRDPGRQPARGRAQHRAADRRAGPRGRPHRDPRAVPLPRDRRQAPQQPRRLPGHGAGGDPRRRPDRRGAAGRGGRRHRGGRRRRRHHRRPQRGGARPRGRRPEP